MPFKKLFPLAFTLILVISFLIRIIPSKNNNFYFTMDQGNDAVHIRQILEGHELLKLKGPETGLKGVHVGSLWYYFAGAGYLAFGGHPFGAVFMLVIASLVTLAIVMLVIARHVSRLAALITGASLSFFWWYFEASRWGFNPFPLVYLAIITILLLSLSRPKYFFLAAIPVGLTFNTEAAGAMALLFFYLICGLILVSRKFVGLKNLLIAVLILASFFATLFLRELNTGFLESQTLIREFGQPQGIFSSTQFPRIATVIKDIVLDAAIPQNQRLSLTLLLIITTTAAVLVKSGKIKLLDFSGKFAAYSLLLVAISYLWFSTNLGWRAWHTVYIQPLLFISLILVILKFPKTLAFGLLTVILAAQFLYFKNLYLAFAKPSADPGILANQITAVDWVYQKAGSQGFYVYNYLPSVYDYPYQYLFWWHGRRNYGYVPCEYATFPATPNIHVPGEKYYQQPQRPCTNLRFLVIEPDTRGELRQKWIDQVSQNTKLIESTVIGKIRVEKREITAP